ncbi:MAG: bifunctional nuclease family protein [Deltaproteobacteria bacterium]
MSVQGLTLDPISKTPIVVLRDENRKLTLPIWVGLLEATAMASELEGTRVSRPLTHDLLRSILDSVEIQVESVEVNDLRDHTYYSLVNLRHGDRSWSVDARPSDAIALALRVKCPIWVAKHVLEQSNLLIPDSEATREENLSAISPEKWADILAKMSPDDFKYKM